MSNKILPGPNQTHPDPQHRIRYNTVSLTISRLTMSCAVKSLLCMATRYLKARRGGRGTSQRQGWVQHNSDEITSISAADVSNECIPPRILQFQKTRHNFTPFNGMDVLLTDTKSIPVEAHHLTCSGESVTFTDAYITVGNNNKK